MLKSTAKWMRCEAYVNVSQKRQPGNEQRQTDGREHRTAKRGEGKLGRCL